MAAVFDVIFKGWTRAGKVITFVDRDLFVGPKTGRKRLLTALARRGRDATRKNIRSQGNGRWPPLSPWTRAQTGRRKALVTAIPMIKAKKANREGTRSAVIFRSPGDWTLTQHHDGFKEPGTNKPVKIQLKRPGIVGLKKKVIFLADKGTTVPPRPVWPEGRQLATINRQELVKWRADFMRRLKRVR